MTAKMTLRQDEFHLPIRTEKTLRDFVKFAWGVSIPDVQVCQNHSTPWRAFADAYFARSPVSVWHGSRGFAGKSFTLALLSMTEAVTLGADVNVLGGSGEQSKRVLEHMQNLWHSDSAPRQMLQADAATVTRLKNGAKVAALMASQASVRGPHPQRLRLDECLVAGTMIASPNGNTPIQCLSVGDVVYSVYGKTIRENKVTRIIERGIRETIVIESECGKLVATAEHPILTKSGWKQAGKISPDDTLLGLRETHPLRQGRFSQSVRRLLSKIGLRKRQVDLFLREIKDRSLPEMLGMLSRLPQRLCQSLCGLRNDSKAICNDTMQGVSPKMDEREGTKQDGSIQGDGTWEKNEQAGNIGYGVVELLRNEMEVASFDRQIRCGFPSWEYGDRSFWRLLAYSLWLKSKGRCEDRNSEKSRLLCDYSETRDNSFLVEGIRVASVSSGIPALVYDITIERDGNFIANGIVSHNCDEMALPILDAALGQPMSKGDVKSQVVMSSTRQYSGGTMDEVLQRATKNGWPIHQWCYRETMQPHGWLKESDVNEKRGVITAAMWQTEYENQEPNPSARAIQPAAVERMFDKSLGEFDGSAHEYIETEAPAERGEYATGADWARKGDWTIITTYRTDVKPVRCVAWERTGRLDWPVMVRLYDERLKRYGGAGVHDGTGIGDVVDGYITAGGSRAFIMAGRARADLLSEYVNACEKGDIVYPFIRYAYQEHKFASVEAVMSGGTEHLPDSISAGALGWNAVSKKPWLFMN
jgi:hypothetical protein